MDEAAAAQPAVSRSEESDGLPAAARVHQGAPKRGTCFSIDPSPNAGNPADLLIGWHFPVEALCMGCGARVVARESLPIGDGGGWLHEDRAS
jgi:hypothetical protein